MVSIENIENNGLYLSSDLSEIVISTDAQSAQVYLMYDWPIFDEVLYASEGKIILRGFDKLIKKELLKNGSQYHFIEIGVDASDGSRSLVGFYVLFCERKFHIGDVGESLSDNFLSTSNYRRICPGQDITAHLFSAANVSLTPEILFTAEDSKGKRKSGKFNLDEINLVPGVWSVSVRYSDILSELERQFPGATLVGFTLQVGDRYLRNYVDRALSEEGAFSFVNIFGVTDFVCLPVYDTVKSSVESSEALAGGSLRLYDRHVTHSHEIEAGPLSRSEAMFAEQMLSSGKTWHKGDEIVITSVTCELPDSPEKMYSVKFTWRTPSDTPEILL